MFKRWFDPFHLDGKHSGHPLRTDLTCYFLPESLAGHQRDLQAATSGSQHTEAGKLGSWSSAIET